MKNDSNESDRLEYLLEKWGSVLSIPLSGGKVKAMLIESRESWNLKDQD